MFKWQFEEDGAKAQYSGRPFKESLQEEILFHELLQQIYNKCTRENQLGEILRPGLKAVGTLHKCYCALCYIIEMLSIWEVP